MMKRIVMVLCIVCCGVGILITDSMAAERLISIPTGARFEKVGDVDSLRLPDGSKIEVKRIAIRDNAPIQDNIFGECEMKVYDQAGRLQDGKGLLMMNPAEGRLVGGKVRMPIHIKFVPGR